MSITLAHLPQTASVAGLVNVQHLGHLLNDQGETPTLRGVDDLHQFAALPFLRGTYGDDVLEPIRLHVDAKRYLCAVEPDYFAKLSPDSVRSLGLQGGPMSAGEIEDFRRHPLHAEAVRLRRYDEAAKDPRARTPDFDHFLRHVAACRRA